MVISDRIDDEKNEIISWHYNDMTIYTMYVHYMRACICVSVSVCVFGRNMPLTTVHRFGSNEEKERKKERKLLLDDMGRLKNIYITTYLFILLYATYVCMTRGLRKVYLSYYRYKTPIPNPATLLPSSPSKLLSSSTSVSVC